MIVTVTLADTARDPLILDRVLKTVRSPGDVIQIQDGVTALTRGNWNFPEFGWISLANGVTLRGGKVALSPDPVRETGGKVRPSKDVNILWCGENTLIQGVKFDCTAPKTWNGGGLRFHGRYTVEDCEITGLSGTLNQQEVFAISSAGNTRGSVVKSVRVFDCLTDSPTSYVSGIYIGATEGDGGNIVQDCDVQLGPRGWFAYSSTEHTTFLNCRGSASRFWYTDTGDGEALLSNCEGSVTYAAIGSVAATGQPTRRIHVRNCRFSGAKSARVVEWWSKPGSEAKGYVALQTCVLEDFAYSAAVASTRGSVVFVDCKFQFTDPLAPDILTSIADGSPEPLFLL